MPHLFIWTFIKKWNIILFTLDIHFLFSLQTLFYPQWGFLLRVQLSISFNLLYMNIYTPESWRLIWWWRPNRVFVSHFSETYIYYSSCINLNWYKKKMCTTIFLWASCCREFERLHQRKSKSLRGCELFDYCNKTVDLKKCTLISFGKWKEKNVFNLPGFRRPRKLV